MRADTRWSTSTTNTLSLISTSYSSSQPLKVNLKAPSKTILIQLLRNACASAVVDGYRDMARFNIKKLTEDEEEDK